MATKKEIKTYDSLIYDFKPTIRTLLRDYLQAKLYDLRRGKETIYQEDAKFVPEPDRLKDLPLNYFALVLDGKVEEMIRLNEETAKLLVNKKTKLIPFDPAETIVKRGMSYSNKMFVYEEDIIIEEN